MKVRVVVWFYTSQESTMSSVKYLREFVTERLTAAAEEIFGVFEKKIVEYEEEIDRQRKLLDVVWKPVVQLHRLDLSQQHVLKEEEVLSEQQLWNQEDPEPPHIKEEQEELCTSQEGEQLDLKQETETIILIPAREESEQQLLSQSSAEAESQVQEGVKHVDLESPGNAGSELKKRHHSDGVDDSPRAGRQCRDVDIVWKPKIKLHRIDLPQQYVCTLEVLNDQERNSSMEELEPPGVNEVQEELCTSQEERDHSEAEENQQLLSHSSPVAEGQDQGQSKHSDSGSTTNAESEPEPKKRDRSNNVDNCSLSKTHCDVKTGDKKSFKCGSCSKAFQYKYQLNVHRRIHSGEKPYVCRTCRKRFRETSHLKKHINIHRDQNKYLCRTCGKGFVEMSKFKRHLKTHTCERPYTCDTCGKGFSQVSGLKAHTKVHTDERPYVCKTCGKKFRETSKLKKHFRIHTGEKPYVCNTCGKKFTENSVLIRHERVHTGERPYPCDTCGKRFKQAAALSTHSKIHTGEKPYACSACGKRFYRKTHLKSHMRVHTD